MLVSSNLSVQAISESMSPQIVDADDVDDFDFELPSEPVRPTQRTTGAQGAAPGAERGQHAFGAGNPLASLLAGLGGGQPRAAPHIDEVKQCVTEETGDVDAFQLPAYRACSLQPV